MATAAQQPLEPSTSPSIFTWYKNEANDGLEAVYRAERIGQGKILQVIQEFNDSYRFNDLRALHTDARDAAKNAGDSQGEEDALMALLARVYIAGTMRYCKMAEEEPC